MLNTENLHIRDEHIAESCELHFNQDPLKIVRAEGVYMYDDKNKRYIEFVSRITNVGHCNPAVVQAASRQMSTLSIPCEGADTSMQQELTRRLLSTLPDSFEVVLYTNSGSEANDLALQMARDYTKRHDLVVVEGSFHGTSNLLIDICPRAFRKSPEGKKPWVHVIPAPDTYRGPYSADDPEATDKYIQDAKNALRNAIEKKTKIAGFICEPIMVVPGVLIPPKNWLKEIYSYIHELGGLVIADEIQCGMGRTGDTFWAFQSQDAIPDILTVGKPLGNGHPIGAVITSRKIADKISGASSLYKCDPVGAAVSTTVLRVMAEQELVRKTVMLGTVLGEGLKGFVHSFSIVGDVRHKGLIIGVDIVKPKGNKIPAPEIAEEISNRMRNLGVLVGCESEEKNVLLFLPALCISKQDCMTVIETFGQVVEVVQFSYVDDVFNILSSPSPGGEECSMKIMRYKDQYLFDDKKKRYIDFVSGITNVGHCNPAVVEAEKRQMLKLGIPCKGADTSLQQTLTRRLLSTLPPSFEVVLYTNSGSEANDLALRMARNYTNRHDLVVVDGSFHGTSNLLKDICPKAFRKTPEGKKPWVHVIPAPDTYRGRHSADDPEATDKYIQDAKNALRKAMAKKTKIAGFICEPIMIAPGVLVPPKNWLNKIYRYIHELGGLVIADENLCGMGRTGDTFWAFQSQNAIPDILTVGKPLGNGYPIGAVITSSKIAASIEGANILYKCDPVGAAVSTTVLRVMDEKELVRKAVMMGTILSEGFKGFMEASYLIGDVRHKGLIIGVDIIKPKSNKNPAPDLALKISNKMRELGVLVGRESEEKNVLLFLPALCISKDDCMSVLETFGKVVANVQISYLDEVYNVQKSPSTGSSGRSGVSEDGTAEDVEHHYDPLVQND